MSSNIVKQKSYNFALRIVNLYQHLEKTHKYFPLSKQVLRSGTSIGANIEEADGAQSKRDFIAKLQISYKEAKETHYWLRLLRDTGYLQEYQAQSILSDCEELVRLLSAILKSSKRKE